jgi:hypothetical protein
MLFLIDRTWDGDPAEPGEVARVCLEARKNHLLARIEAPHHGDPSPSGPPGSTERLWEHEVVELFLVGHRGDYLEVELGPHGHYLALKFRGERELLVQGLPLEYSASIVDRAWRGEARIPRTMLPEGLERGNAFAIHGTGMRRHLAAHPTGGAAPDFHRIACYPRIEI